MRDIYAVLFRDKKIIIKKKGTENMKLKNKKA